MLNRYLQGTHRDPALGPQWTRISPWWSISHPRKHSQFAPRVGRHGVWACARCGDARAKGGSSVCTRGVCTPFVGSSSSASLAAPQCKRSVMGGAYPFPFLTSTLPLSLLTQAVAPPPSSSVLQRSQPPGSCGAKASARLACSVGPTWHGLLGSARSLEVARGWSGAAPRA